MAIVDEVRLSVSKTINLGNYESIKIETSITLVKNKETDTAESMRIDAIDEVWKFLNQAMGEFGPEDYK
jgi:hypothetical protein